MGSATIPMLLRVKRVIDGIKAIDQTTLTEQERYAVRECLDHAYDLATAFLTELGESQPNLLPACLTGGIVITIIRNHLLPEEEITPE